MVRSWLGRYLCRKDNRTVCYENDLYYAVNGKTKDGWREIETSDGSSQYYYFDPTTLKAVDGVQTIRTMITENGKQYPKDLNYAFEDHVLVRGADRRSVPVSVILGRTTDRQKWWTVDGDSYFFGDHGDALTGFSEVPRGNSGQGADYYLFDAEGALIVQPGLYQLSSDLSHIASGFSAGDIVCFDENGMAILCWPCLWR